MIGVCHTGGHTPQSPWESLLQGTGADWDSGTGPLLSWRWTGGWALQLTQRVSGFTGGHPCRPRVFGSGERDCSSPSQCLWGGALGIWGWGPLLRSVWFQGNQGCSLVCIVGTRTNRPQVHALSFVPGSVGEQNFWGQMGSGLEIFGFHLCFLQMLPCWLHPA